MFEDAQGREVVRMQAERDRDTLVKNNSSTTIRANRTMSVGADNTESITGHENIAVGQMRGVTVMDSMTHTVQNNSTTSCLEGNNTFDTKHVFSTHAETNRVLSDRVFEVLCGRSIIYMTTDHIIMQSPKILLNPGASIVRAARSGQPLPPSQAEQDAQALAAQMRARQAAIRQMMLRSTVPFGLGPLFY
jgi:type VI secretion system secreted protein VgrG